MNAHRNGLIRILTSHNHHHPRFIELVEIALIRLAHARVRFSQYDTNMGPLAIAAAMMRAPILCRRKESEVSDIYYWFHLYSSLFYFDNGAENILVAGWSQLSKPFKLIRWMQNSIFWILIDCTFQTSAIFARPYPAISILMCTDVVPCVFLCVCREEGARDRKCVVRNIWGEYDINSQRQNYHAQQITDEWSLNTKIPVTCRFVLIRQLE